MNADTLRLFLRLARKSIKGMKALKGSSSNSYGNKAYFMVNWPLKEKQLLFRQATTIFIH